MKELKFGKKQVQVVDEKGNKSFVEVPAFVLALPATIEELQGLNVKSLELVFASIEEVVKSKAEKRALFMVQEDQEPGDMTLDLALSMEFKKNTKQAQVAALQEALQELEMENLLIFAKMKKKVATDEDIQRSDAIDTEAEKLTARVSELQRQIDVSNAAKSVTRVANAEAKAAAKVAK